MPSGPQVGLWLLGARGSVATTATVGLLATAAGHVDGPGLVTASPLFCGDLPALQDLVVGGHDVVGTPVLERCTHLVAEGVLPYGLAALVADGLAEVERRLRPGVSDEQVAADPAGALQQVVADLEAFRAEHDLAQVVVVQLTSTEAGAAGVESLDLASLRQALAGAGPTLPPSVVYAAAALEAGCAFVDFTPSIATTVPGIRALAEERRLPLAGRDGKTGETLVKTALAPMLVDRALKVRAWAGTNLLGGGDGASLADPDRRASKLSAKAGVLEAMLGEKVEAPLSIEHVPSMGEWKTAWDHITFEGFLGTRMTLQFTWQGCDSTLAAPLVLDLARLVGAALRTGHVGPLPALAYFFKDPLGTDEHRIARQFDDLVAWAGTLAKAPVGS